MNGAHVLTVKSAVCGDRDQFSHLIGFIIKELVETSPTQVKFTLLSYV